MRGLAALVFVLPAVAAAAEPPGGVKYEAPRGLFARTGFGVFTALGGQKLVEDSQTGALDFRSRLSNAQPFLQLQAGYDLFMGLSATLGYARGEAGEACFKPNLDQKRCEGADNFSVNFIEAGVDYAYPLPVLDRLAVHGGLIVGYAIFNPDPQTPLDEQGNPVLGKNISNSVHFGAGMGATYDTRLRGFSVSADVGFRLVAGINLPSLSFAGAIKYVF